MDVDKIIERRAVMDVRLDIQTDQLWGDDEIEGDVDEIKQKIRETIELVASIITNDVDLEVVAKQLRESNGDSYYKRYVPLWQTSYRKEKAFFMMAAWDKRFDKILARQGESLTNPRGIDF